MGLPGISGPETPVRGNFRRANLTSQAMVSRLWIKLNTARLLGLTNVFRALVYRAGIRTGLHPACRVRCALPSGPFFVEPMLIGDGPEPPFRQIRTPRLFGWVEFPLSAEPPDWHFNVLTGQRAESADVEWWRIPDFDPAVGDIKGIWEASRFDWTLTFAQRAIVGETTAITHMNQWIADWCEKNPTYKGTNWKCGQESSIRVMHLAMTAVILNQVQQSLPDLLYLIEAHLKRIAPTISYAVAQDNNHGTSEAAALFVGGSWLARRGVSSGEVWARAGRKWLENRVHHLIGADGSFSQYSLNYHRVLLDTLSMVEVWRHKIEEREFSRGFYERAIAATNWLCAMIAPQSGDGPNLGANDGARLLPLTPTDSQDLGPSAQLASVLFRKQRFYEGTGTWDAPLHWLGVPTVGEVAPAPKSELFDDGGYAVLRNESAVAIMRYPRFRFRPSHADALHVDLWIDGANPLRDGGSYSYNTEKTWLDYFPGTASHNTIQFDGHDQMPRLGRFLFGDWLKANDVEPMVEEESGVSFAAGYSDAWGARHRRRVSLGAGSLEVQDEISGRFKVAILRWRLNPGAWVLDGNRISQGQWSLRIESTAPIERIGLVEGWESRHYGRKTTIPVLEVQVGQAGLLKSSFSLPR